MLTVSNTSQLLNLAIVGQFSLVRQQFGVIRIPPAVLEELRIEEDLPGSQAVKEALEDGWLKVEEVEDQLFIKALQSDLDKGEAETIALALQVKAKWTLLDERDGRSVAKSLGLKVTGVLGILLRAWRNGELSSLQEVMEDLREKAGFHIKADLFNDVLRGRTEEGE